MQVVDSKIDTNYTLLIKKAAVKKLIIQLIIVSVASYLNVYHATQLSNIRPENPEYDSMSTRHQTAQYLNNSAMQTSPQKLITLKKMLLNQRLCYI